jgi:hypothetical protein
LSAEIARAAFERFFFFFLEGRDGPGSEGAIPGTSVSDPELDSSPAPGSALVMSRFSGDLVSSGALDLVDDMLGVDAWGEQSLTNDQTRMTVYDRGAASKVSKWQNESVA